MTSNIRSIFGKGVVMSTLQSKLIKQIVLSCMRYTLTVILTISIIILILLLNSSFTTVISQTISTIYVMTYIVMLLYTIKLQRKQSESVDRIAYISFLSAFWIYTVLWLFTTESLTFYYQTCLTILLALINVLICRDKYFMANNFIANTIIVLMLCFR